MNNEKDIRAGLFGKLIEYVRQNHPDEIDKAYEYFWEEEYPEDFLSGITLDIAFINFEDWLIYGYKDTGGNTFIDLYIKENEELKDAELRVLKEMKESIISLYEVKSDSTLILNDLLFGMEFRPEGDLSDKGFGAGSVFAARFLKLDGMPHISGCVYPYGQGMKEKVLSYIDKQFNRYRKNERPDGSMKEFLKAYPEIFNIIWVSNLYKVK